jgi:hypothetical protein
MKRRRVLLTIAGLGSVVALLGLAGLIAPFTDRATTGPNSIESGERAREVDLQLASKDPSTPVPCGQFTNDLATGLISVSSVQPSTGGSGGTGVCVKNAGSSTTSVSFTALDLSDVDTACTGDEAAVDIGSCGNGAAGELSPQLTVGFQPTECETGLPVGVSNSLRLDVLATTSSPLPGALTGSALALAPGETACFDSRWSYGPTTADAPTVAQTDQATWRFAFDGTQAATP